MHYEFIAIPDEHLLTCASETDKSASVWRAIPNRLRDLRPLEKTNPIRAILVQRSLPGRRFFAKLVGTEEPPVEELLPPGERRPAQVCFDKYVGLSRRRFPGPATVATEWWLEERHLSGGLKR